MTSVGLYGLEASQVRGELASDPDSSCWRNAVAAAVAGVIDAVAAGVQVEDKGMSLTLHYRRRPEAGPETEQLALELGRRTGLSVRPAKMSVELHPDVHTDKGNGAAPAGRRSRRTSGVHGRRRRRPSRVRRPAWPDRVGGPSPAVLGEETSSEVSAAADLLVDGPSGALRVLSELAVRN